MASQPEIRQVFIGRSDDITDDMAFERKLYVIRKLAENAIRSNNQIQVLIIFMLPAFLIRP